MSAALEEQKAYYRARASEYDEWFLRTGRYNRGIEHTNIWFHEVQRVIDQLDKHAPFGDVLEFAGGTGLWSQRLSQKADSVTVVDASPEMIEINRERVNNDSVCYIHQDIFEFESEIVRSHLKPGGRFFFIDSLKEGRSTAVNHCLPDEDDSETLIRKLNDGREYRIIKIFYKPQELQKKLEGLRFKANVTQTDSFFLLGHGEI